MKMEELQRRIDRLEYHQQVLLRMLKHSKDQLFYLIISKDLSKKETEELLELCEILSNKFQKQKAEGYVTFYPLLTELKECLSKKISYRELIQACLQQEVYIPLMKQLQELLEDEN